MSSPTLVILAAWIGSRYWGLKQIDSFGPNNEAVLSYSVFDAQRAGFEKVVFVIRQSFVDEFYEKIVKKLPSSIKIEVVFQDTHTAPVRERPRGTGHAVLVVKEFVNEPFAVINADDYYGVDSFRQIVHFLSNNCKSDEFGMVGYTLQDTMTPHGHVNRGVCDVDDGYLRKIEERLKIHFEQDDIQDEKWQILHPHTIVSMNFRWFHPAFFGSLEQERNRFLEEQGSEENSEFYLPSVCDQLIKSNQAQCRVITAQSERCGVTYPEDKPIVQQKLMELIEKGVYPTPLR